MTVCRRLFLLFCIATATWCILYQFEKFSFASLYDQEENWNANVLNLSSFIGSDNDAIFLPSMPKCPNLPLNLIIIVCSSASNFGTRQVIRSTWGSKSNLNNNIKVLFIIGRSPDKVADDFINYEKLDYSDIIHYNFLDTYGNLTLKSFMLLEWVYTFCNNSNYIMKTDDDTFVNIRNLNMLLAKSAKNNLLLGNLIVDAKPVTDPASKLYTPKSAYSGSSYPNYVSGSGYVMSNDVIPLLHAATLTSDFLYLEDVFITGICAKASGLVPVNHDGFNYIRKVDPCALRKLITTHRITPTDMCKVWRKLQDLSINCDNVFRLFFPFLW